MIREEIQDKKDFIKVCNETAGNFLEWAKTAEQELAYLEKQLAKLEVEVYEPIYLNNVGKCVYATEHEKYIDNKYIDRHNAGEELKKLISEENQKQGWKVDWEDGNQDKYFLSEFNHNDGSVQLGSSKYYQKGENELYFSEQSLTDQDFLDKIKPLWLKWKGIAE